MKKLSLKTIVVMALLVSANFVVTSIFKMPGVFKYSPAFLIVALAGREYGVLGGALVGGLGDFLSAILFPVGAFLPGITLTAALVGATYGIFMKNAKLWKIALAVVIENFVLGLFLNTFWLSLAYDSRSYMGFLIMRLPHMAIMTAVSIPLLYLLNRYVPKLNKE